jgi:hypothetical protein
LFSTVLDATRDCTGTASFAPSDEPQLWKKDISGTTKAQCEVQCLEYYKDCNLFQWEQNSYEAAQQHFKVRVASKGRVLGFAALKIVGNGGLDAADAEALAGTLLVVAHEGANVKIRSLMATMASEWERPNWQAENPQDMRSKYIPSPPPDNTRVEPGVYYTIDITDASRIDLRVPGHRWLSVDGFTYAECETKCANVSQCIGFSTSATRDNGDTADCMAYTLNATVLTVAPNGGEAVPTTVPMPGEQGPKCSN